jgi:hypothetical protein
MLLILGFLTSATPSQTQGGDRFAIFSRGDKKKLRGLPRPQH